MLWSAAEESPQRVAKILGESKVLRLVISVEDNEGGSLAVIRDNGQHETSLVDHVVLLEFFESGTARLRGSSSGYLSLSRGSCDRRQAETPRRLAARIAGKGAAIPAGARPACTAQCQKRCSPCLFRRGRTLLFLEGWVRHQFLQDLCSADAIRQGQVPDGSVQVVNELIGPVAVLPLVREPGHLLCKLVELFSALAPNGALCRVAELPLAEVLPQAIYSAHVSHWDLSHLSKEDPSALQGSLATEHDEQAPGLCVGSPEILGRQQIPQGSVIDVKVRLEGRGVLEQSLLAGCRGTSNAPSSQWPPHSCSNSGC
mmetsp:Transcript_39/g.131  ORF Transcript_39/g.131 Transcript_39/m.131 type:complete len:314 (+) Transcript_39:951-1892(+)